MSLQERVKKSLKWKKSDTICANRLNISIEECRKIKEEFRDNNQTRSRESMAFEEFLEDGKATVSYTGPKEIKTKEDIIRECNIDLEKYTITRMVHNAWGKEGNQSYQVKAWLSQKDESIPDILSKIVSEAKLEYKHVAPDFLNHKYNEKTCAVISLQDIHIGKEIVDKSYTSIQQSVKNCLENLVYKAYHSHNLEKIIFVLGADLLNMDTVLGTTTSGTFVDNSLSAYDSYKIAFDLMFWSINFLKQFCNELEVVYVTGNHDRLSSYHIAYALSKMIISPGITWNVDYNERKVIVFGNSMVCLEHGDFNINRSFFAFATEFPKEWGATKYRVAYTGHFHKERKKEYITTDEINGFTLRTLPSLSKTDRFHKEGKWTENKRGGVIELHSYDNGPTGQFSYFE